MNPPDLDLDLVRCFIAVAESGGFTAASRRLHLTQSAVSLKIQRLEALVGRSVLNRSSRSLSLTAEGELLLGYGRRLLALNREMLDRISRAGDSGLLRLGVMPQFGQQHLPALLAEFKQAHPWVELAVEIGMTGELLAAMEADRHDLVVGAAGFPRPDSLQEERILLREKVSWVQSASATMKPGKEPLPLVLFPAPCGYRKSALDLLDRAGLPWRIAYTSTSISAIQAAVIAGLGIGVLGKSSMVPGMKAVPARTGLPALPEVGIAIYSRKSPSSRLGASFASFLAKAVHRVAK